MENHFEEAVRAQKGIEADLLLKKHRDYGPKNIADSPGGPLQGLRVRLHDKLARFNHLLDSRETPEFESLLDTALDIANYGTIMALVLSGEWPSVGTTWGARSANEIVQAVQEAQRDQLKDPWMSREDPPLVYGYPQGTK